MDYHEMDNEPEFSDLSDSSLDFDSVEEDTDNNEESLMGPSALKKKRGRPVGSKRQRTESSGEDGETNEKTSTRRKLGLVSVTSLVTIMCCSALCLTELGSDAVVADRELFQSLTSVERRQWLLNYFWSHSKFNDDSKTWTFIFVIGTTTVCCTAFRKVLGISRSSFYAVRKMFLNKQKVVISHQSRRKMTKSMASLAWLKNYAENFGEKLPNTCKIHLPPCSTKVHVYETMVAESQGEFTQPVSMSHFLRLWREEANHIAIPKNNRFSKCNTCTVIKVKLGETRDQEKRKLLREMRDKHLRKQNLERQKYYKHQQKARSQPQKYLSMIIDGMDQNKTQLPHFVHASKFTSTMWRLRVHLVGVIVHGIGIYGFFDLFEYSHSTNLTLSVLLSVFYFLRDSLPDTLYLQMDNCARENKNRYLLGFMAYLVEKGIFRKIKISFLMVGHTHEDIDQIFSKFSHWLGRHAAMTLDKLLAGFEKCYTPRPTSIKTSKVYNITEWLTPFMNPIKNHSRPHVFKIERDNQGKAKISWKEWSTDKNWNETGEYLLKEDVEGDPLVVHPDFSEIEDNFEKLESDVRASYRYFAKDEDKTWWTSFFRTYDNWDDDFQWILPEILESKRRPTTPSTINDDIFDFEINDERPVAPVIIGKKAPAESTKQYRLHDIVLVDIPKYAGEWPQLCEVLEVKHQEVTVHWYKGSKTTSWTPCTRRVKGMRGRTEPWTEKIAVQQIWSSGFRLTPSGHIPKKIREELEAYDIY